MTDPTNTPPPLPKPEGMQWSYSNRREIKTGQFTHDQMRAYGDARAAHAAAPLQARIDALMLEYCPDEMVPEQMAEWERHQKVSDVVVPIKAREVTDAEIDALASEAIGRAGSQWLNISRHEMRRLVRAAIALANGRG